MMHGNMKIKFKKKIKFISEHLAKLHSFGPPTDKQQLEDTKNEAFMTHTKAVYCNKKS